MMTIPLALTQEHSCSYLENQQAQSLFVHPSCQLTTEIYEQLIMQGFRRSGDDVYKPQCQQCTTCIPVRIEVAHFIPGKSQKRCLEKNKHTRAIIKPPVFEQAHYDMYLRYQANRHADGAMAQSDRDEYLSFLGSSWCDTFFVEFLINDELAGLAVIDQFDNALSAVYTFFEPKFAGYSPGVYAVLWQIEQARQQGRQFLYLGYWIKECKKMAYKSNYQPLQQLLDNEWIANP